MEGCGAAPGCVAGEFCAVKMLATPGTVTYAMSRTVEAIEEKRRIDPRKVNKIYAKKLGRAEALPTYEEVPG